MISQSDKQNMVLALFEIFHTTSDAPAAQMLLPGISSTFNVLLFRKAAESTVAPEL
jgi:hypothetical protein